MNFKTEQTPADAANVITIYAQKLNLAPKEFFPIEDTLRVLVPEKIQTEDIYRQGMKTLYEKGVFYQGEDGLYLSEKGFNIH